MTVDVENARRGLTGEQEYVGRPSPLGNPYMIGKDGTREEVIAKYEDWLVVNLGMSLDAGKPNAVTAELDRLKGLHEERGHLRLACWCSPLPCHASVIRKFILGEPLVPLKAL